MKQHIDSGGEVSIEDRSLGELDVIGEVCWRPEIGSVDDDHVVVHVELVGEVRSDKFGPVGDEDALALHT
jgi:hypothetical protein